MNNMKIPCPFIWLNSKRCFSDTTYCHNCFLLCCSLIVHFSIIISYWKYYFMNSTSTSSFLQLWIVHTVALIWWFLGWINIYIQLKKSLFIIYHYSIILLYLNYLSKFQSLEIHSVHYISYLFVQATVFSNQ